MNKNDYGLQNAQILISTNDLIQLLKSTIEEALNRTQAKIESSKSLAESPSILLTRKEACRLLGISLPTLSKHIRIGKVPYCRIGKKLLFEQQSLLSSLQVIGGKNG